MTPLLSVAIAYFQNFNSWPVCVVLLCCVDCFPASVEEVFVLQQLSLTDLSIEIKQPHHTLVSCWQTSDSLANFMDATFCPQNLTSIHSEVQLQYFQP